MPTITGRRRRLVTIEQVVQSKGPSGRPVDSWEPLGMAWMAREDADMRPDIAEHIDANQRSARTDVTWRMLYQANMDSEVFDVARERRLVYLGRIYNIVRAVPDGPDVVITTIAKAG